MQTLEKGANLGSRGPTASLFVTCKAMIKHCNSTLHEHELEWVSCSFEAKPVSIGIASLSCPSEVMSQRHKP
jgi:hypothetical protein